MGGGKGVCDRLGVLVEYSVFLILISCFFCREIFLYFLVQCVGV